MLNILGESQTIKLGEIIANNLEKNTVIALIGDLGSGKTTLSKSIIKNMMNVDDVPSPTFNIVNEYSDDKNTIYHFDFYRLEDENELFNIGFDDYISNKKAILIIEWADKFINMMPKEYIKIEFEKNDNSRKVRVESVGNRHLELCKKIMDMYK